LPDRILEPDAEVFNMPIIEYHCRKCGNRFEDIQTDVKESKTSCPNCKSKNIERVLSIFSSTRARKSSCDFKGRYS
jgi:putative FmdB family regulatory protein